MVIRTNLVHEPSLGYDCCTPSRTQQQFKDECDINHVIENYTHGVLPPMNDKPPVFGDFTKVPQCYGDMVQMLDDSREAFMALPSDIRRRFNDDPVKLMNFIQDEKNLDEAVKLGLITKPDKAEPKEE